MSLEDGPCSPVERPITSDGVSTAGQGTIARSPLGCLLRDVWPVIATEAHVTFAGASQQTNNSAQLSSIIEALRFFSLLEPVPRGSHACIFHDLWHAADVGLDPCNRGPLSAWD